MRLFAPPRRIFNFVREGKSYGIFGEAWLESNESMGECQVELRLSERSPDDSGWDGVSARGGCALGAEDHPLPTWLRIPFDFLPISPSTRFARSGYRDSAQVT
jgi:hypothetical protein